LQTAKVVESFISGLQHGYENQRLYHNPSAVMFKLREWSDVRRVVNATKKTLGQRGYL
jgi:hypothetical protein